MILYKRILSYIKPYLHILSIALLCTMLAAAGNLYLPWIFRDMIDKVLNAKDYYMLNVISASIVVIFLLRGIFLYGQNYLMSYVGQHVIIDIRSEVFRKLQRLSMSFYDKNKTGTIMSYVTNDVNALQGAMVDNTIELVTEGIILIGSVCAMVYLDWKLTLFTILTFPVVLYFMNYFGKKIRRSGGQIQEATADITSVLQESVSSARVVKSFVREQYEIERFERENEANLKANLKNAKYMATLTPTIEFVAALGVTLILWYGGNNVIAGETTAGSLVAFLAYAVNISNPIKRITRVSGNIQRALAAAQRVFDVLDLREEVQDLPDAKALPAVTGNVSFEHVTFSYNAGDEILHDLSFTAKPGQAIGLVGPSGAGKSTVASLLPRFYDCDAGTIRIDGTDIRHVTLDSLRNQVGIVPQETILFNGSVYDNILYGRLDATKEEIEEAAKAANAHDFIMELPDGYNTMLGDRGVNISGGQRQRIAIARAILKDPRILVLDEATSALDTESERVVQEALNRLMVGRTSIIIAHRLSTIKNADRILVLDKGKLAEDGTHEELMAKNGLYAHLYQIQYRTNKEES
ncbi:lipid A export permease/ATP-binding protein MsbA [Succiniclasticum ruminis]|uniref:ATP-binding cassette, subfamily B, MsbA n=1 Tax=Succiniclasticum ruminis DSM 9236 TaxID=1123323 RepID=A0A1I2C7F4_9FIRM|nr:lipid A export permease/ATP-binding protein MsbA [Succiniclasticum ruminis]SFE64289.1 ATP-binding cassette, subfamily B, MsbA [Succiniclasticum ruminis DSM 9236]